MDNSEAQPGDELNENQAIATIKVLKNIKTEDTDDDLALGVKARLAGSIMSALGSSTRS